MQRAQKAFLLFRPGAQHELAHCPASDGAGKTEIELRPGRRGRDRAQRARRTTAAPGAPQAERDQGYKCPDSAGARRNRSPGPEDDPLLEAASGFPTNSGRPLTHRPQRQGEAHSSSLASGTPPRQTIWHQRRQTAMRLAGSRKKTPARKRPRMPKCTAGCDPLAHKRSA